jgi:hypothetical protein
MATSTFYKNIYIDDKAAKILVNGINSPKPPWPDEHKEDVERGEALLRQYRSRLVIQSERPKN